MVKVLALSSGCGRTLLATSRLRTFRARFLFSESVTVSNRTVNSSNASTSAAVSTARLSKGRKRYWIIVGGAGAVTIVGTWWSLQQFSTDADIPASLSPSNTRFTIPIRMPDGSTSQKVLFMLSDKEVDDKLRKNEQSTHVSDFASNSLVQRYETNKLASNDPIEDRNSEFVIQTKQDESQQVAPNLSSNLAFFAVMDGHAGFATSELLSQTLIPKLALEIENLSNGLGDYAHTAKARMSLVSKLWSSFFGHSAYSISNSQAFIKTALRDDPEIVKRAIIKVFKNLDDEIVRQPVELLKSYELSKLTNLSRKRNEKTEREAIAYVERSAYETVLPALSGSCALMTCIDTVRKDIYVACTGDSRAVAGVWNHERQHWEVDVLSKDQTGRNEDEIQRMRAEHPSSEAQHVIMRGRVLGGLEPTRAFGDARYKWDRETQRRISEILVPSDRQAPLRGPPRNLLTPPYVTAEPVVEWRRLTQDTSRDIKFIVMATDGLWDNLSSEDAVALVAEHLSGFRGTLNAAEAQNRCFTKMGPNSFSDKKAAFEHADEQQQNTLQPTKEESAQYTFKDENIATHLTRNALGGANHERLASILAIPAPLSRRYRDDITVNVIVFNPCDRQRHIEMRDECTSTHVPHLN